MTLLQNKLSKMGSTKICIKATFILATLMVTSFHAMLTGQNKYFQVQIGSQVLQNYNLGKLGYSSSGYTAFTVTKESGATTFNHDISISTAFNRHHGLTLGGGLYNTCRLIDGEWFDDTRSFLNFEGVKSCYKNYNLYLMYQYTSWLSSRWNGHLSVGPMWAKNHNMGDWFFIPVKLDYFSGMIKLGAQFKMNDHFLIELNGMAIRSVTNIVDVSRWVDGSFIPLLIGADLRIGYQF